MDDTAVSDDAPHGRVFLIFVAVVAMVAVAGLAAHVAMGVPPAKRAPTEVLAASLDARPTSTTAPATTTTSSNTSAASSSTTAATTTTTTAPVTSTGRFLAAAGTSEVRGTGEVHTYSVEAEEGSQVAPDELAAVVDVILADSRGWTAEGHAFQRVPTGGSFTISLATPATTDAICEPLDTAGKFSCHEGHRVVLNLTRWNEGTTDLVLDLNGYRAEVVNHEVGHELGLDHVGCGGAGEYAPVMMQQSKGLDGCAPNPWPTLDGAPAG